MNTEITKFDLSKISKDSQGRLSLTDLFRASNKSENYYPAQWQRLESTKLLVETVASMLNVGVSHILKMQKGAGGGTFAHKQLFLAYAKYLSPELHFHVNQVFFERLEEEKNPDLAIHRGMNTWVKKGKSEKWVQERIMGIATRRHFTDTLKNHGVKGSVGYIRCTDAIYKPLYGGGSKMVREKKQLAKGENIRENMSDLELAGVRLAELLSSQNIEDKHIFGNTPCAIECEKASKNIAQAIISSRSS
jgi:hypothetical protein